MNTPIECMSDAALLSRLAADIKAAEERKETIVDVECPKCGKKIWRRDDIVLTSYPAKYQYECECGWVGYAYV